MVRKFRTFNRRARKKSAATVTTHEPKEITDMKRIVKGFPSAILSGRASHFLSTKRELARKGDWFEIDGSRFVFISEPKSVSVGFAKDVLYQMLGYMSTEDFLAGTKMVMVEYTPSKKLWLWAIAPSIEHEDGAIHHCRYMPGGMRIRYVKKSNVFLLENEAEDWAGVGVYNCPGCRAILTPVIE